MNTKSVLAISALTALLLIYSVTPVFAVQPDRAIAKVGKGVWDKFADGFGNTYDAHKIGSRPLRFAGHLATSPYLVTTPWSISGSQHGNTFTFRASNPTGGSDGNCAYFDVTATFSSSTAASGSYTNSPDCGSTTGSISFSATGPIAVSSGVSAPGRR